MPGISKSQFSHLCEEIDSKLKAFLNRPLEGGCVPAVLPNRSNSHLEM